VRAALARRGGAETQTLDRWLELDERWRAAVARSEALRAEQNEASKAIGMAKGQGRDASAEIAAMQELSTEVKRLGAERDEAERERDGLLAALPNLPDPTAAPQDDVLREVGEAGRTGRDHLELAGSGVDMERGARLSGSRFAYLRGELVFVELALVQWTLRKLAGLGFEPVIPPVLVREEGLFGTGFLPDTEQQIYHLPEDDLYLAGTSEVALASMHAGELLDEEDLPRLYAGFSPCFRREAGAAGRDQRGIFRVHQFDKVEMFSFVAPEESPDEHLRLLAIEEEILTELGIPYRVVDIAVDDLGASAARSSTARPGFPARASTAS
jgi:seryl-tRNA synthetase